jgi:creatinine amidohydrolase
MKMELAGQKPERFLPAGHVTSGRGVCLPLRVTNRLVWEDEVLVYPEGVIGRPTLATAEKAKAGLDVLLDYMCKLVDDIMTRFPAGQLPPMDKVTMRDPKEVEALLKGPSTGNSLFHLVPT